MQFISIFWGRTAWFMLSLSKYPVVGEEFGERSRSILRQANGLTENFNYQLTVF
jgi:hypothetical protein